MYKIANRKVQPVVEQSPSITVRPMVLEDIPELAELYRQFWNQSSSVPEMTNVLERILPREDYIFLSAVEGTKLIGSVQGIVCEQLYGIARPFLVLHSLVVDPCHRRKGVARLLLDGLESRAKAKGCYWCDLISYAHNEGACSFYRANGFYENTVGFRKPL